MEDRHRQIEELFHAVLQLERSQRDSFLARACVSAPSMRAEVEALISAHETAQGFLSVPAFETAQGLDDRRETEFIGKVIGHYEIVEFIGRGGMGEVYRARDTHLNRPVAIKFISSKQITEFARRRFRQEARIASALNHPHILTVHEADEFEGHLFLLTEFVDGGTVGRWVRQNKPEWLRIVDLLIGVADGLACAHESGILHRDIKPDNILVTRSGYAKLADFGLAKLIQTSDQQSADVVTVTRTQPGMLVGTIAYMSPEQASGKPLDARSDIFAFGVVLYELLRGRRPFEGQTDFETLQRIIGGPPEPLGDAIPSTLRAIVEKALEKDPAYRYQSMREMLVDLRRASRDSGLQPVTQLPSGQQTAAPIERSLTSSHDSWSTAKPWMVLGVVVITLISASAFWLFLGRHSNTPVTPVHQEYTQLTNFADSVVSPALSPDGRMLTFIRGESTFVGRGEIYVQLLPGGEPAALTHDGVQKMSPVFSLDGSRIAYTVVNESSDWQTWTVSALGGEPRRLLTNAEGLNWIPSGASSSRILFSELIGEGVHMAVTTATESRLDARRVYVPPGIGGMAHRSALSPDGKSVLVVEMGSGWYPCRVVPFDGSNLGRAVGPSGGPCTYAAWSPDGRWIYLSANSGNGFHIWRQKFPDGEPEQVTAGATEEEGLAFSPDGRSFVTSIGIDQNTIWIHDSHGERQLTSQGYAYQPKFSRDGKRLYYMLRTGSSNQSFIIGSLWVMDLSSGNRERLFPDLLMQDYSISADGTTVALMTLSADESSGAIWIAPLDGSRPPSRLPETKSRRAVFGPDGDLFVAQDGALYRIKPDGTGRQKVVDERERISYVYGVSPDGNWVAVWAGKAVNVYPLRGGQAIELCPVCGTMGADRRGITPPVVTWSRDGKFLYMHFAWTTRETYVVPLQRGQVLPPLPKGGISAQELAAIPGAKRIPQLDAFLSEDDPSVYAFMRQTSQRNIYRVPVP